MLQFEFTDTLISHFDMQQYMYLSLKINMLYIVYLFDRWDKWLECENILKWILTNYLKWIFNEDKFFIIWSFSWTCNSMKDPNAAPYFHGKVTREQAEDMLLCTGCVEGSFLLRQSADNNYAVSICHNGK